MRPMLLMFSLLMTALPFWASANDTASATIFLSVNILPQSATLQSLAQRGDSCAQLLVEDPVAYLASTCGQSNQGFEVSQLDEHHLLIEPI